ncbi:hypothetical protein [Streptomyces sp. NPDC127038]|uniref:hypothetical protein n=1 Tax=Streptomyces sp. NPDC127038 TaxID=3347114 RepID=UPI003662DE0E
MRGTLLAAAIVPAVAMVVLKVGRWQVDVDRKHMTVTPRPRRNCTTCRGAGGVWTSGSFPEMEACGCWSERRHLRIPLRYTPATDPWPDEPEF